MAERRLGRGLDFFLSGSNEEAGGEAGESVVQLPIDDLVPNPHQPRREFPEAELQELAASVRSSGILQPILARKVGEQHQIIAGERRWRAARIAELETVPVLVRSISDDQSAVFGLVENLHREDLNPIEKAQAFRRLQEVTKANQEEIANQVGLDRSTVANFLRLLDLPSDVQAHVSRGTLSMGHARSLLAAPGDGMRKALAERTIRERLSVRALEELCKEAKSAANEPETATSSGESNGKQQPTDKGRPLWLKEIEDNLRSSLDTGVEVRYGKRRSKIVIECSGRDEFERVYELLRGVQQDS